MLPVSSSGATSKVVEHPVCAAASASQVWEKGLRQEKLLKGDSAELTSFTSLSSQQSNLT
jgi:hypothetical protein